MKLINPKFEIISQEKGLEGIYKNIEKAGRTCYKSENKITKGSAEKFTNTMVNSGHGAMLEHGTVYLKIEVKINNMEDIWRVNKYRDNKFSFIHKEPDGDFHNIYFITTNYRVLIENNWTDDLKYLCEPTKFHEKRITVKFICDRGVSHEYVRHRVFSFAQESTRYCNYTKDKFGKELTFIKPFWINNEFILEDGHCNKEILDKTINLNTENLNAHCFLLLLLESEISYNKLLENGWTAQEARQVLPNALKTELVMTGFVSDWKHFFELRCDKAAHPQARELAIPLQKEFEKLNLI